MKKRDLPTCPACGSRDWQLEGKLQILFCADADDPAGPFKREGAVDSRTELHFWCKGCGEEATPGVERSLSDVYRAYDRSRALDPHQGGLLDVAFLGRQGEFAMAQPPRIVRRGLTPLRVRNIRGL